MPIESSVSRIDDLNPLWPRDGDIVREGAAHIRNIKIALGQERSDKANFIVMYYGELADIPPGWVQCNGQNGTPDMRNMVPVGAGGDYTKGQTGGSNKITLTTGQLPSHSHTGNTQDAGNHSHSGSTGSAGYHGHSASTGGAGNHRHSIETQEEDDRGSAVWITRSGQPRNGLKTGYTEYAGNHSHSVSVSGNGSHTHSVSVGSAGAHKHSFTTNTTGDGDEVDVRQPFRAVHFIMWVG